MYEYAVKHEEMEKALAQQNEFLQMQYKTEPVMAGCLAIILFSMAGIPPLAGFVGKLLILNVVVDSNLFFLAVIAVLTSVIAAFYYIRMVKSIFFDEPTEELDILTNNHQRQNHHGIQ